MITRYATTLIHCCSLLRYLLRCQRLRRALFYCRRVCSLRAYVMPVMPMMLMSAELDEISPRPRDTMRQRGCRFDILLALLCRFDAAI